MEVTLLIFQLIVLLFSAIIHEVAHGVMALRLGDQTAKLAGRITLNPIKHLDFMGSFLVPLSLFFLTAGAFVIGWAKPVPYNPFNLKDPNRGAGLIAAAGPISNIVLAIIFGAVIRLGVFLPEAALFTNTLFLFHIIVIINIALAIFNLLPIPPLDGSNILFAVLPRQYDRIRAFLTQYGFLLLLLFVFFGFDIIRPVIWGIYRLIVGGAGIF